MSQQTSPTAPRFQINVKTAYVPEQSQPEQGFHFFAYRITIKNVGSTAAQLQSRHWIITDGRGQTEEVRGPGVVGQQPRIPPGQSFEYESACPLSTSCGSMRGTYHMTTDEGSAFDIEIPEFYLISPQGLH